MGEKCCECGAESNGLMIAVVKYNKDKYICIGCLAEEIHTKIAKKEV